MTETNPYAPPKASLTITTNSKCRREGKWVVVEAGADLPPRCIICNEEVTTPIKSKKVYWHTPWLYLLILINIIVYAVAGLIARKSFPISPGLCEQHAAKRRRRILFFFGAASTSFVAAVLLLGITDEVVSAVLFILTVLLLVTAGITSRTVYARKITNEYARLGGFKEPFLNSLK